MATRFLHLVGPQGCGKSTLARFIVDGIQAAGMSAVTEESDTCFDLNNAQLRRKFAGFDVAVIEADAPGPRHDNLAPGDQVWCFSARG